MANTQTKTSAWASLTDEQKAEHLEKAKVWRHRRRAKALGISLEEYQERLDAKKAGKTSREAGLVDPAKPSRVDADVIQDINKTLRKVDENATRIIRGGNHVTVLFRKQHLVIASFFREAPVEGQKGSLYFVNTKTKKRRPLMKVDYKPTASKKNEDAIQWDAARTIA